MKHKINVDKLILDIKDFLDSDKDCMEHFATLAKYTDADSDMTKAGDYFAHKLDDAQSIIIRLSQLLTNEETSH